MKRWKKEVEAKVRRRKTGSVEITEGETRGEEEYVGRDTKIVEGRETERGERREQEKNGKNPMMWEMEFDDNKVVGINRGYLCTQRKKREERGKKITLLRIQKGKT